MKRNRPEYEALVPRILSGELTRKQAADISSEQTGLVPGSFLVWLNNSGRAKELKAVRGNAGQNSIHAHKDPDKIKAYADALALALSGDTSVRAAADRFNVSYKHLLSKYHKAVQERDADLSDHQLLADILGNPERLAKVAAVVRVTGL